jgi:bifunctional DNase/RNase
MKQVIPLTIQNGFSESGSYILMLAEVDGNRSIPIFTGVHEAQGIMLAANSEQTRRPMTHQLMTAMMNEYGLTLREVTIDRVEEGIFYATLHVTDGFNEKQFDSRPTDAVTLALLTGAKIMVDDKVIDEVGMESEFTATPAAQDKPSIEQLEAELLRCEETENYERAAEIQKQIEQLKGKQ